MTADELDELWLSMMNADEPPALLRTLLGMLSLTPAPLSTERAVFAWRVVAAYVRPRSSQDYRDSAAVADVAHDLLSVPDLPAWILVDYAARGPASSLPLLAARPDLPRRAMMDLYRRCTRPGLRGKRLFQEALIALACNPAFPVDRIQLLAYCERIVKVRAAAASRADLPAGTARRMLADPDPMVTERLAMNPNVPADVRVLAALAVSLPEDVSS
jgi:hypothetical protein